MLKSRSPDDETDHPAGDFSSPEYADPSLAEESPLEYDEDEEPAVEQHIEKEPHMIEAVDIPDSIIIEEEEEEEEEDEEEDMSLGSDNTSLDNLSGYSSRSEERLETLIEEQEEEVIESSRSRSPIEDIIVKEITKSTESFTRHVASIGINLARPADMFQNVKPEPPKENHPKPPKQPPPKATT